MKLFKNEEEAVSPVIGVILMVAIVVILAAVIAAFVFGMAGSSGTSKNIGMTVSPNATDGIDILWQGGSDLNSLRTVNATSDGAELVGIEADGWSDATGTSTAHPEVGEMTTITGGDVTGTRVIIIGTFTDGSSQVIFDRRY